MIKFHLVLDTTIYRKSPWRTDIQFQALERLCKAKKAMVHVPYIVEREIQTQQVDIVKTNLERLDHEIICLLRMKELPQISKVKEIKSKVETLGVAIAEHAKTNFSNWMTLINAKRHPITEQQSRNSMEAYFLGALPFKSAKARNDIPDAFILQSIISISKENNPLVVITEDANLLNAAKSSLKNATFHSSLLEFIGSDSIQKELKDVDVLEKIETISNAIRELERETGELTTLINDEAEESLNGRKIFSHSIRDDNREATIVGMWDIEDVSFSFDDLHYFGNGEFGLPFGFSGSVNAIYYIFKGDYYSLPEDELPSVSDHNDHYFEAESTYKVIVSGLLKICIDVAKLSKVSVDSLQKDIKLEIESIDSIEIEE